MGEGEEEGIPLRFSDRLSWGLLFPFSSTGIRETGGALLSVFRALCPDATLITFPYTRGLLRSPSII